MIVARYLYSSQSLSIFCPLTSSSAGLGLFWQRPTTISLVLEALRSRFAPLHHSENLSISVWSYPSESVYRLQVFDVWDLASAVVHVQGEKYRRDKGPLPGSCGDWFGRAQVTTGPQATWFLPTGKDKTQRMRYGLTFILSRFSFIKWSWIELKKKTWKVHKNILT